MLSRIIHCLIPLLILLLPHQTESSEKELWYDVFGSPPSKTTTAATTTSHTHDDVVDKLNDGENSGKVTIRSDILAEIFGSQKATEPPQKDTDLDNILNQIFTPPNQYGTTDSPNKESTDGSIDSAWPGAYTPCKMQNNQSGICVPYYLCDVCTELVITDGQGILDVRGTRDCPEALLVCCLKQNAHFLNDTKLSTSPSPVGDFEPSEEGNVTDGPTEAPPPGKKVTIGSTQCGVSKPQGLSVRIDDKKLSTLFGEFPWVVGILSEESPNWDSSSYLGGGSLLGPRAVLTAAHTVLGRLREEIKLRVRAGEWETKSENERLPHIESMVEDGIVHDDYNSGSLHNDIALLILETPIERNQHIGYACLPAPRLTAPVPPANCYSTGWGTSSDQSHEYANFLKKIKMPIVPPEPCQKDLRTTELSATFRLHHSFLCAGGKQNEDTCQGDGGSPLVCPIPGQKHRYAQFGIVSFGVGCGQGHPGLYANVANYRTWVDDLMRERKLDTSTYSY